MSDEQIHKEHADGPLSHRVCPCLSCVRHRITRPTQRLSQDTLLTMLDEMKVPVNR